MFEENCVVLHVENMFRAFAGRAIVDKCQIVWTVLLIEKKYFSCISFKAKPNKDCAYNIVIDTAVNLCIKNIFTDQKYFIMLLCLK